MAATIAKQRRPLGLLLLLSLSILAAGFARADAPRRTEPTASAVAQPAPPRRTPDPRRTLDPRRSALDPRRTPDPRRSALTRDAALERGIAIGRGVIGARLAIAVAVLGLFAFGRRLARAGLDARHRRRRRVALGLLALAAFATSYNFFVWRHYDGFHAHEIFHYYLGSKFFPELGYFDLYDCATVALAEGRPELATKSHVVRDLRRIFTRKELVPARFGERCNGAFSASRWALFRHDVQFVRSQLPDPEWARATTDQGFNGSPVWILFGRSLASIFPAEAGSLRWLVRLDLLLLAVAFSAVAWAFGFEGLCLVLIAWALNPLSRYEWVGDTLIRQLWLASALVGICLLRRARPAAAGVLLALSALLRIFPLFFALGYALRQLRCWLATRRQPAGLLRFTVSGLCAGLLLVGAAIWVCGRGPAVIAEFAENMTTYSSLRARNSMGLQPLLSYSEQKPPPILLEGQLVYSEEAHQDFVRATFESRRALYWGAVVLFVALFWRALRQAQDWEAAALGFVFVLLFTQAASYYMTCTAPAILLALRRPRIGYAVLGALIAWCVSMLSLGESARGYAAASAVALAMSLCVLFEMTRPAETEGAAPLAQPAGLG